MSSSRRRLVHVVTDRRQVDPAARTTADEVTALERWLEAVVEARVDVIQVRERDLEARVLAGLVGRLVARARGTGVAVVVNDRADAALAAGAAGVHLRADGPPVDRVRAFGPPTWLVGRSVHTPHEAAAAGAASYLLVGTMFPSRSKPPGAPVGGLRVLAEVAAGPTPAIAIGGVTPDNAAACIAAGAAGVAGIGVFLPPGRRSDALGPGRAASALRAAMGGAAAVAREGC